MFENVRLYNITVNRHGNGQKFGLQLFPIDLLDNDEQVDIASRGRNAGSKRSEQVYSLNIRVIRFQPSDGFLQFAKDQVMIEKTTDGKNRKRPARLR